MTGEGVTVLDPTDPPRPDGFYGVSKVAGEALGSYYADRHALEVLNVRIGWYLTREELREKLDGPPERERFARALWLSPEDCRQVMRRSATAALPESPLTIHAISANTGRYVTLAPTINAIDYHPRADSARVDP
jgi:L-arabinose 1-dehydrogenase [NAD(P)+]